MDFLKELKYGGTLINYYFVCRRKLWLFTHQINFERESDLVLIGKLISENSYSRRQKDIKIDETISIDWIDFENKIIHEVKKSDKLELAHVWQVKYYLYYLERKGVEGFKGRIDYPKKHKNLMIELDPSDRKFLEKVIEDIDVIITLEKPPVREKIPACKACSYYEFCWI